jgi:hypothetical protein
MQYIYQASILKEKNLLEIECLDLNEIAITIHYHPLSSAFFLHLQGKKVRS